MKYRQFLKILADYDFKVERIRGSHHQLEGWVDGKRRMVTASYTRSNKDILPKNFASMIRQSGLSKKIFK